MVALRRPDTPCLWEVAKGLVEEYAATLGVPLDFQNFEQERGHLASGKQLGKARNQVSYGGSGAT
jgi:hypothetical protein